MKKSNIFHVNGVWQHGRPDEQDDEGLPLPEDHVEGSQHQLSIPHDVPISPNLGQDSKYPGNYDNHEAWGQLKIEYVRYTFWYGWSKDRAIGR